MDCKSKDEREARQIMQRAYIKFSSFAILQQKDLEFPESVNKTAAYHGVIIKRMETGDIPKEVTTDPRIKFVDEI